MVRKNRTKVLFFAMKIKLDFRLRLNIESNPQI